MPAHRRLALLGAAAIVVACASQGMPPGGPPDVAAPVLLRVTPESGSLHVKARTVEFAFDEVISERPRGASSLQGLVVISPSDGRPDVSWERTRVVIRPHTDWRPNTAYTVTVLPGLSDLRNNATTRSLQTVFATGESIPSGVITGVAFDWMAGRAAPKARIDATIGADTLLRYGNAADSLGRFSVGSLPADRFLVRTWLDENNDGQLGPREPWDTATLAVTDSVRHDFYMFPHDTLGAHVTRIRVVDSLTIRLTFDHGLRGDPPLAEGQVRVMVAKDSTPIPVRRVLRAAAYDSVATREKAARSDSIMRADTSERGRRALATRDSLRLAQARDSAAQLQIDSLRLLRDTVKREAPPHLDRPVPPTEFVVETAGLLPVDTTLQVVVTDAQALEGPPRSSSRLVMREKSPARDTTGRPPPRPPRPPPPRASRPDGSP